MQQSFIAILFVLLVTGSLLFAQETVTSGDLLETDTLSLPSPDTLPPQPLYRPASTVPPKSSPPVQAISESSRRESSGPIINSTGYIRGKMDGERDARGTGLWYFAGLPGVCCYGIGLGGILFSYLLPPSPPEVMLVGKSVEYILGYSEGYKNRGRMKNVRNASLGCLTGTAIGAILIESAFPSVFIF